MRHRAASAGGRPFNARPDLVAQDHGGDERPCAYSGAGERGERRQAAGFHTQSRVGLAPRFASARMLLMDDRGPARVHKLFRPILASIEDTKSALSGVGPSACATPQKRGCLIWGFP